jgi:hypothetical protein
MNQDQETPDEIVLDDEDIKTLAEFYTVLIEIEQDLKRRGIAIDDAGQPSMV